MATSQARAETVVNHLAEAGTPAYFLHPQGFGGTCPKGTPEENRRVEICVISAEELEKEVRAVLAKIDTDGNGVLSKEEFRDVAVKMNKTEAEFTAFWKKYDGDGDGYVNFEEFTAWYLNLDECFEYDD